MTYPNTITPKLVLLTVLADAVNKNNRALQAFLPKTLEERVSRMHERLNQKWPTFGQSGLNYGYRELNIPDHDAGTVVLFFEKDARTFVGIAAVKHGAYWHLSKPVDEVTRMNNSQMKAWLLDQSLNWVVVL